MIRSILDTDLYKFTTSYAYFKLYPQAIGTFTFNDREKTVFDQDFLDDLKAELKALERISLSDDEFEYMIKNCKYIPQNYFEWLRGFRFDASKLNVWLDEEGHLQINVTDYMYKVTLYEIPVLATVSELFHLRNSYDAEAMIARLEQKEQIARDNGLVFSDFGTRRRFSYDVQRMVVKHLKNNPCGCSGTSNCHLAMELDMKRFAGTRIALGKRGQVLLVFIRLFTAGYTLRLVLFIDFLPSFARHAFAGGNKAVLPDPRHNAQRIVFMVGIKHRSQPARHHLIELSLVRR